MKFSTILSFLAVTLVMLGGCSGVDNFLSEPSLSDAELQQGESGAELSTEEPGPSMSPSPSVSPVPSGSPLPSPSVSPSPSYSPTPSPTPWHDEDDEDCDDHESPSQGEVLACAKNLGLSVDRLVIAGKRTKTKIESDKGLLLKITGNQSKVDLTLKGQVIRGICVVMRGNRGQVNLTMKAEVKAAYMDIAGHQNQIQIDVVKDEGMISGGFSARLRGNRNRLKVMGLGVHPCPMVDSQGNGSQLACAAVSP